jgi:hypothetical protein
MEEEKVSEVNDPNYFLIIHEKPEKKSFFCQKNYDYFLIQILKRRKREEQICNEPI